MKKAEPFTLGGRTFRHIELSTIEQDYWLMDRAVEAGLIDLKRDENETEKDFSLRLMRGLIRDGQGFRILGGLILPVTLKDTGVTYFDTDCEPNDPVQDRDWSPDMADLTAKHLRQLTDPNEKQIVHGMLATAYLRFFRDGLLLLALSESRSKRRKEKRQPGDQDHAPAGHTATGRD